MSEVPVKSRILAGGGLLAVAVASALTTIAAGGGFARSTRPMAEAADTPSATSAPGTASPAPTGSPSAAAPTTAAPSPTPTVKGAVHGTTHAGDLRYFLLPVPSDAEAEGDINGTTLSLDDVAQALSNASTSKSILRQLGFRAAAYRTYRTNDGTLTVTVRLIRFAAPGDASNWVSGLSFGGSGHQFTPAGITNAKAQAEDPASGAGVGMLEGLSHVGDTEYEIDVAGAGKLDHSLLAPLMRREEQRLRTGR